MRGPIVDAVQHTAMGSQATASQFVLRRRGWRPNREIIPERRSVEWQAYEMHAVGVRCCVQVYSSELWKTDTIPRRHDATCMKGPSRFPLASGMLFLTLAATTIATLFDSVEVASELMSPRGPLSATIESLKIRRKGKERYCRRSMRDDEGSMHPFQICFPP